MSKSFHINTILAQAGIKSDKATGALVTPIHFSTTYQHPEPPNLNICIIIQLMFFLVK